MNLTTLNRLFRHQLRLLARLLRPFWPVGQSPYLPNLELRITSSADTFCNFPFAWNITPVTKLCWLPFGLRLWWVNIISTEKAEKSAISCFRAEALAELEKRVNLVNLVTYSKSQYYIGTAHLVYKLIKQHRVAQFVPIGLKDSGHIIAIGPDFFGINNGIARRFPSNRHRAIYYAKSFAASGFIFKNSSLVV